MAPTTKVRKMRTITQDPQRSRTAKLKARLMRQARSLKGKP